MIKAKKTLVIFLLVTARNDFLQTSGNAMKTQNFPVCQVTGNPLHEYQKIVDIWGYSIIL